MEARFAAAPLDCITMFGSSTRVEVDFSKVRCKKSRPEEFEREANTAVNSVGATVSFFRHGEIYQSDAGRSKSGERPKDRPPAHRSDESPAGYSSASCSPAELASASPAELHPEGEEEV
jgi:hypothetical protein